jgi:eukaryotic-like serine/threonine-protein kinase
MSGDGPTQFGPPPKTLADRQGTCDRFESAWRAGQHPCIEDYLEKADAPDRPALLHVLLALELGLRRSVGEHPAPQEYLSRFPQSLDLVKAVFNGSSSLSSQSKTDQQTTENAPGDESLDPQSPTKLVAGSFDLDNLDSTEAPIILASGDAGANGGVKAPVTPVLSLPKKLGRFTLIRLLGQGGFGRVYLAHDDELNRAVAIKIPRAEAFATADQVDEFLREAQLAAGMKHPGIVTVHDVGRHEDQGVFVVLEYIEGRSLSDMLRAERFSVVRIVDLMVQISEAVHYAHKQDLVHRDLKPANILLDLDGKIHVADFGLAIREEGQRFRSGEVSGTPAYMAPEQVRGEAHRLDGRTDLWGLGVIFYEMLTARHPFNGNRHQTFDEILHREPKPPRQIDDTIPKEIERACLKCLSKRMADRYTTAAELAEDLRYWLSTQPAATTTMQVTPSSSAAADLSSERRHVKVVPKGLRSFDNQDADFFLELLPGPKDREGLPDSLRFWKTRIEETEPDKTFSVGLIYGPSGCGKSSLVKAGLLPRLDDRVLPVYIEAAQADTELRLLASLKRRFPALEANADLPSALASIRSGTGLPRKHKVLIVIDQFEQWLHAKAEGREDELTLALRQCDGQRLQCIVMVRDDFWMAITRFMRELEVKLIEGFNSSAVDLFDPNHARKVLAEFGRAFGQLPDNLGQMSPEQERFVQQSIDELMRSDGTIVPVRLSLFGEMVRGKPWTPATLKEVGGAEGIGVAFLEETFSASSAPPEHRRHQNAARLVLKALLPEHRVDIKGNMRSYRELLEASGYAQWPSEFQDLMRILDTELRLVTPTDPAGLDQDERAPERAPLGERYYQLTHDDLVPSLRQWLTRKQAESARGRAELRLAERSDLWGAKPEARRLPSSWEWLNILVLTKRNRWTAKQRKMMRAAARYQVTRGLAAAVLLIALGLGALQIERFIERREASGLVKQLLVADISRVPGIVSTIGGFRKWTDPKLAEIVSDPKRSSKERLRASLALLPVDASQIDYLFERLLKAEPDDLLVIRDLLGPRRVELVNRFWKVASNPAADRNQRFRAACALAAYDSGNDERWDEIADDVAEKLVTENPLLLKPWMDALRPVRLFLLGPLRTVFRGSSYPYIERLKATSVLADYASDKLPFLVELIKDADLQQFKELFEEVEDRRDQVVELMHLELKKKMSGSVAQNAVDHEAKRKADDEARRKANAATTLLLLGEPDEVWPLLKHSPDPTLRSFLINGMGPMGADPQVILARLASETDVSTRRALLLSLVDVSGEKLSTSDRESLTSSLLTSYREDEDPGIHAAAALLLRTWGHGDRLKEIDKQPHGKQPGGENTWYVDGKGHTMVVLDPLKWPIELSTHRRIGRTFEIAAHEVTVEQFRAFRPKYDNRYSPTIDCPINVVTWYEAAAYCRWVSEQEGISEDQMCYPPIDEIKEGMKPYDDHLHRTGYRLPTDAEWEYACRALASADRYYGHPAQLMPNYAWFNLNSELRSQPVGLLKPNDFGLFDMYGNINEWCQETFDHLVPGEEDREDTSPLSNNVLRVVRGGHYYNQARDLVADRRDTANPHDPFFSLGFRVARTHPPKP